MTLVCTVSSSLPINDVQWQRNIGGSITTITSNTTTSKYSGSTTTTPFLTIFSASSSDAGTYTCFASNSVGTGQSTTTTLSVTERKPSSKDFDVTLMICLLRNLIPIDIMDNRLPLATDTSLGADLSRIKFYRNIIVHCDSVADTDFESYWKDVTQAILRVGGNSLKVECDDWYGRNMDAEQRDDGLKLIKVEKRLALVEEELEEQSKKLAEQSKELAEQSKELAEQSKELAEQSKELAYQTQKDMDVNEHERLSIFTPRHKLK